MIDQFHREYRKGYGYTQGTVAPANAAAPADADGAADTAPLTNGVAQ